MTTQTLFTIQLYNTSMCTTSHSISWSSEFRVAATSATCVQSGGRTSHSGDCVQSKPPGGWSETGHGLLVMSAHPTECQSPSLARVSSTPPRHRGSSSAAATTSHTHTPSSSSSSSSSSSVSQQRHITVPSSFIQCDKYPIMPISWNITRWPDTDERCSQADERHIIRSSARTTSAPDVRPFLSLRIAWATSVMVG